MSMTKKISLVVLIFCFWIVLTILAQLSCTTVGAKCNSDALSVIITVMNFAVSFSVMFGLFHEGSKP